MIARYAIALIVLILLADAFAWAFLPGRYIRPNCRSSGGWLTMPLAAVNALPRSGGLAEREAVLVDKMAKSA
jgi:hypothetical protein